MAATIEDLENQYNDAQAEVDMLVEDGADDENHEYHEEYRRAVLNRDLALYDYEEARATGQSYEGFEDEEQQMSWEGEEDTFVSVVESDRGYEDDELQMSVAGWQDVGTFVAADSTNVLVFEEFGVSIRLLDHHAEPWCELHS